MKLAFRIGVALALLSSACVKSAPRAGDLGPVPTGLPTGFPSATASDGASGSATPSLAGTVAVGTADVSATGGLNTSVAFSVLAAPAVWIPPPGTIALQWTAGNGQSLSLGGSSFTSRIATSDLDTLSFALLAPDGSLAQFRSSAGECFVTISSALVEQMGGIFDCANLTSSDGRFVVSAQGNFMASR